MAKQKSNNDNKPNFTKHNNNKVTNGSKKKGGKKGHKKTKNGQGKKPRLGVKK